MSVIVTTATPSLVLAAGERAGVRFLEFFASAIRNPHTRRAYARAAGDFLTWCAGAGVISRIWSRPACAINQRAPVPDNRARHGAVEHAAPAAGKRLCDGATSRARSQLRHGDRQPHVPCDRHYGLSEKRRHARERSGDGSGVASHHFSLQRLIQ